MTTPADSPRSRLVQLLSARVAAGHPMPWEDRDRRLAGVPRSGASGKWYSGNTPWLLWAESAEAGWQSAVWHTASSVDATIDEQGVKMGRSWLYAADRLGLVWGVTAPDPEAAAGRVSDLHRFIGISVRPGRRPDYTHSTGVIHIAGPGDYPIPADRAATLLELMVLWTRDERRLDRDDDALEPLVGALGGALLSAAFRVPGISAIHTDWKAALDDEGESLFAAMSLAEQAVDYLMDLAHPALRAELAQLDETGEAERSQAGERVDVVTNLGQILLVDEMDLREDEDEDEDEGRSQPLVLADAAGSVLYEFLEHFSHESSSGRKNPPLCAWLAGGPGTGRNQVVAALNALFRTGGTDLGGTLVSSEGDEDLLAMIEEVWSQDDLLVLPATLPSRVRVQHDRAIPTACLESFHIRYGLSPHLWVARLEHRLIRSGEYEAFAAAFEERTGKPWRVAGQRNPDANKEAMVHALGGAAAGARRRLTHYERTRRTASWEALLDEAGWSLYHLRPGETHASKKPVAHAERKRTLFVLDLSTALQSEDPVARGWLRRCLGTVPARMDDLSRPSHRPFWFLMTPDISLKELTEIVGWQPKVRRKQVTVDLDQNPVTAALSNELLGKDPAACGPIYRTFAHYGSELLELYKLDGIALPSLSDRDALLASFPFLPCVIPVAQAVLDTFAGDRDALPLLILVRKALDEQYYAPPDRFVPLDLLLEPLNKLLEQSTAAAAVVGGPRIFVGAAAVTQPGRHQAFPHETVLQTLRWANRIRGFPCTARNLVPLMLMRMDRPVAEMIAEVEGTLEELIRRDCVRTVAGPQGHRWVRGL